MDSPIRQQQKRNDYLRHKLFRKINRRRRAKRQQDIEAPAKELKKRLRQKRTFEDGKDGDRISKSSDFSDEQLSRLVVDNSHPDPRYTYDPSDPKRIGSYMNVLEKNGWSINDPKAMQTLRELYDIDQTATPFDHFAFDAGPLPEVTVKPDYNKWYNLILRTYYPFHKGRYSLTGHSELSTPGGNRISTNGNDADYNFILNNCSDATRKALEQAYHKAINPFLFTTPGDVKDFAEQKLGGKTKTAPSGGLSITEIPVKLAQLQQISKYAKQIEDTGKYAGGKDRDVITNSRGDSYRLDPNLPMWNDDGTLNAVIDNVTIYSPRGYREANERRINNMLEHTEDPRTGYAPGLKLTFPEFDLLTMSDLAKPFVAKGLPKLMNQWRLAKSFKPIQNFVPTLNSNNVALSVREDAEYITNPILKRRFLEANENVNNGVATEVDRRFIESMKKVINTKRGAVPISEETKQGMLSYYNSERYRNRVMKNVQDEEAADAFINDALETIQNTPIERNPLHPRFTQTSEGAHVEGITIPTRGTPKGTESVIVLNENAGQDVINHELNHAVDFANKAAIESNKKFPLKEIRPSTFTQNGKPYMLDDIESRTRAIALDKFLMEHPEYTIDDAYKSWYDPFHTKLSFNDLPLDARNFIVHYTENEGRTYFDNFFSTLPFGLGLAGYGLSNYNDGKDSGIHIKPENRGKFTRLKKRTGHSTAWFKAHGTPAQKKMATFAQNAKKWHH